VALLAIANNATHGVGSVGTVRTFVYSIPMTTRFRGITVREGMLVEGPAGWGEFCPFPEYDDAEAASWLAAALEAASLGWPAPVRERVPVNCIVPAVGPDKAQEMVRASGCATAKVKVADEPGSLCADLDRVAAVRDALGAGEAIRRAADPLAVDVTDAADVAILKVAPLGGVRRALAVAEACGLPCVVSSALETSVGLAAEIALAAALPELEFACGLGTIALLRDDVVDSPLRPVDGMLPVVRRAPDPVRRSALPADDDRTAWWDARLTRVSSLLAARP